MSARWWWWLVGVVGCGSVASIDPRPTSDGGGAAVGGSGGATTSTMSSTTSSGSDPCDTNADCSLETWCARSACGGSGICIPPPEDCPEDCPGICGCDGVTHCNACVAATAGINVLKEEPCEGTASYRAVAWYGGLDHLILMKANESDGRCVRIYADAPSSGPYSTTMPDNWAVSQIVVGELTLECLDETVPLVETEGAVDAVGSITWDGMPVIPCELTVDVLIDFGEFLVPEPFQATLSVDGCQ